MKKQYIIPQMECFDVQMEAIVALSTNSSTSITSENKADFEMQGRDNSSNFNLWDQEW